MVERGFEVRAPAYVGGGVGPSRSTDHTEFVLFIILSSAGWFVASARR